MRDGRVPDEAARVQTQWADPATPMFAPQADGVVKLYSADELLPHRSARRALGLLRHADPGHGDRGPAGIQPGQRRRHGRRVRPKPDGAPAELPEYQEPQPEERPSVLAGSRVRPALAVQFREPATAASS
jgi:hypothetical protein